MKGIKLLFAGYLALSAFGAVNCAFADDSVDAARAATSRRGVSTTVVRQQSNSTSNDSQSPANQSTVSRTTNLSSSANSTSVGVRDRTNTTTRSNVVVRDSGTRTTSDSSTQGVSARTTATVMPRSTVSTTNSVTVPSRTAVSRNAATTVSRTGVTASRNTTTQQTTAGRTAANEISRTATLNRAATSGASNTSTARTASAGTTASSRISRAGTVSAEEIINKDITQCREVYYSCMDEFCANKDSQLKRCACSSRVNEFDSVKEQLSQVEDKLLDFNQRLLTVNMDKEDAEAIFTPTEGELAFQQEDTSDSKKLLDEISEKLNSTFDTSTFDANLAPITLSLNADAAFDSVDSLAGASTTTKTGTALYSAALPVCREMALEVCSQEELDIIESGYQMAIEQDCNTVAKAYQTQQDLAREKIREGSALLDISRLDTYQQRNSDDILTCKKKMLDMLTNTSVCGTDLQKCLDISGQYIDPSTGEAILTENLVNLSTLITRPTGNQTWTTVPNNEKFVKYLDSKKMFLESATENCQDISDYVWDLFIEDALAQIKLAQESKLEEVRQGCTTLTTQCLTDAAKSLEDFDARALSIFGVTADKTVKQMCSEVQTACTALLDTTSGGEDWNSGMTEIATDKTYETILQTCREIGKSCIIQSCKSISGNFGLCENIQTSVNRKAIINRTACWDEVLACVKSAEIESINKITELQKQYIDAQNGSFYTELYGKYDIADITNDELSSSFDGESCIAGQNGNCIYDICASECGFDAEKQTYTNATSNECQACRLAEKVWGNCEAYPATNLQATDSHNMIKMPKDSSQETLLSWFAKNTNTSETRDSCRDTSCGPGMVAQWDSNTQTTVCVSNASFSDDGLMCPSKDYWRVYIDESGYNNCCMTTEGKAGGRDSFGNCCLLNNLRTTIPGLVWKTNSGYYNHDGISSTPPKLPTSDSPMSGTVQDDKNGGLCLPDNAKFVMAFPLTGTTDSYYGTEDMGFLFCTGNVEGEEKTETFPSGQTVKCNGDYVIVMRETGKYISPNYYDSTPSSILDSFYRGNEGKSECIQNYNTDTNRWTWEPQDSCEVQSPTNWILK